MAEPQLLGAGPDHTPGTTIQSTIVENDRVQIRNVVNDISGILLELLEAFGAGTSRAGLPSGAPAANAVPVGDGAGFAWSRDLDLASLVLDTPLAVDQGGTGATTAAGARTNLGVDIGGAIQAHDALLDAIAALVTANNKLMYFTGVDTVALADITAYGRSILAVSNEAALKALINAEAGTDFQAQDAELAAIAGLTSAADRLPYFTGLGAAALATFTAYARTLVAAANATAARTVLGLGSGDSPTLTGLTTTGDLVVGGNAQIQGQGWSDIVALSDGASIATNCNLGNVFTVTLGGNRTLANPTNLKAGASYIWRIKQDGTGNRTLAYGTVFAFPNGSTPVLSTPGGAIDVIAGFYDGTDLLCAVAGKSYA